MQLVYFGAFDPPHIGHVRRLAAARERCNPARTIIFPLDSYDGATPGRRIVRTKLAAALAAATDAEYNETGLETWNLQPFVTRLAARAHQPILVLFDPELPSGLRAEDLDARRAGIHVLPDTRLGLPSRLPRQAALQRLISNDTGDWRQQVVEGVETMVIEFRLYGWPGGSRR